jgi:hypothetical protein
MNHNGPDAEFQRLADRVQVAGRRFGHREHVQLAWLSVRHYGGAEPATARLTEWLRHLTAAAGRPQKYHYTVSRAWVELVAHHLAEEPVADDFDAFAARHPGLLDKRLLGRHYSSPVLASAAARREWVEPDLRPFPWHSRASGPRRKAV